MTRILPLAVLAVFLVAADKPADNKPTDKKTDKDSLQGTWILTRAEVNGEAVKLPDKATLTFKGDAVDNSLHPDDKWTFTLDPDKKPPTMDFKITHGTETETQLAVYELKGDTLIVCIEKKEKGYPKAVASKEGNMFLTLKRVKAEDKPKPDAASQKADLATTKTLATACETYKLNNGDWPANLEALANNQPKGGRPIIQPALLAPKSAEKFKYDPKGLNNKGLRPDIWVDGPNGPIGNWMEELPPEEKKPEK